MTDNIICKSCGTDSVFLEVEFGLTGNIEIYAECEGCGEAGTLEPGEPFFSKNLKATKFVATEDADE